MAFEEIVLDPTEIDSTRSEFEITPFIAEAGVDWGTAEITAYMAEQERGATAVDFRIPNRTVVVSLMIKDTATVTFQEARSAFQSKVAIFQAEGGTLRRTLTDADMPVYLDVVNASLVLSGDWLQAHRDVDMNATLTLECVPDFYGEEIQLTDHTETTATELRFVETAVKGDYPARVRIVVDDDQGVSQRGLIWSVRSRYYDAASTAVPAFEAESLQNLDTAVKAGKTGASNGSVVTHGTLSTTWTPVLGTNIGGTTWLTHRGTNRIWARVWSAAGDAVEARLIWSVGDLANPTTNDPARLYDGGTYAGGGVYNGGTFHMIDLGEVRLDPTPVGSHRWQGQIQARGEVGGEPLSIDRMWVVNTDDGYGVLRSPFTTGDTFTTYSARSDWGTESGAITNDLLRTGGSWVGAGGTADFSVTTAPSPKQSEAEGIQGVATRVATSDANLDTGGRFVTASATTAMTDTVVQADIAWAFNRLLYAEGTSRYGVLARAAPTATYLWFGAVGGAVDQTKGSAWAVIKRVSSVTTTIATFPGNPWQSVYYTLRLEVLASGFYTASVGIGETMQELMRGYDSDLATGGGLASGKVGLMDAHTSAVNQIRSYKNFAAWAPTSDAVIFASQSAELRTEGMVREDAGGTAYTPVSIVNGDLPRLPPAGLENRSVELMLKGSRGDFQSYADPAIDDISARVTYRPSWLLTPES